MKKKTEAIDWARNLILYCNSNNAGHCPKYNNNNIVVEELTADMPFYNAMYRPAEPVDWCKCCLTNPTNPIGSPDNPTLS